MIKKEIVLEHRSGLHIRPASMLAKNASKYKADFFIIKDGTKINGKSVMGIMMLGVSKGTKLELIFDGVDEEELMKEVLNLFENNFGEKE
ncbi:MAG: HPr family phosphocarrier protein [Candidatus Cloacimonetes bacterium]|nr:HPr family phosphocarrier protein [Candidatus Cloacimonadota bacterium]MBS3767014.1 HPr family phosphocarrier protein [Candidatus Cloacimonadota bacterium]